MDWASKRPESLWGGNSGNQPPSVQEDVNGQSAFEAVLTQHETDFYAGYQKMFPNSVYSLNQDPAVKPMKPLGKERLSLFKK